MLLVTILFQSNSYRHPSIILKVDPMIPVFDTKMTEENFEDFLNFARNQIFCSYPFNWKWILLFNRIFSWTNCTILLAYVRRRYWSFGRRSGINWILNWYECKSLCVISQKVVVLLEISLIWCRILWPRLVLNHYKVHFSKSCTKRQKEDFTFFFASWGF